MIYKVCIYIIDFLVNYIDLVWVFMSFSVSLSSFLFQGMDRLKEKGILLEFLLLFQSNFLVNWYVLEVNFIEFFGNFSGIR